MLKATETQAKMFQTHIQRIGGVHKNYHRGPDCGLRVALEVPLAKRVRKLAGALRFDSAYSGYRAVTKLLAVHDAQNTMHWTGKPW